MVDEAKRILVIGEPEDSEDIRALINAGFQIEVAKSGEEAAEKLASGAFRRVVSDCADMAACYSARKEAESREQTCSNLIERSNDAIAVLQDQIIQYVNPRFEELSGYSAETLVGTKFTDYLIPEEIAVLLERYKRRMAGEYVPSIYESSMTRRGGAKIPLEISAAVVEYHGRPADLVLIRDITERKQAEEFLRRYYLLSESARDMILFVGLDGRIIEANKAAVDGFGYSHEELTSMSLFDLGGEEDLETIPELIERARREKIVFEVTHLRKDGSPMPVEVSLSTAMIQDEPMLLAIVRDNTERKLAKEALERSLEQTKRESLRASALESIAEAGLSILRLPELLDKLVELIAKALDVDACCVFVLDEESDEFEAHAAYNAPGVVGCRVKATEGLVGRVATEGRHGLPGRCRNRCPGLRLLSIENKGENHTRSADDRQRKSRGCRARSVADQPRFQ